MNKELTLVVLAALMAALVAGVMYGLLFRTDVKKFELSRLYFAVGVLLSLGFVFVLAMLFYVYGPDPVPPTAEPPGKVIFDACVKVIPPIATLIIGFYFGTYQATAKTQASPSSQAQQGAPTTTAPK